MTSKIARKSHTTRRTAPDDSHVATARIAYETGLLKGPVIVLLILANQRLQGWTLGAIAKATGMSVTVVNNAKKKLVKQGLAELRWPARDQRQVKIYLTDEGRDRAYALWQALGLLSRSESDWWRKPPPYDPA